MEHTSTAHIIHEPHDAGGGSKEIWKVTIILSVLTIIELALGFIMMGMSDTVPWANILSKGYHHHINACKSILYRWLFHALKT